MSSSQDFFFCSMYVQADLINEFQRPLPDWPSKGVVEFKNYSTRYRSGLDLVLKNINFKVNEAEKVIHCMFILSNFYASTEYTCTHALKYPI